jgi:uncharacterized membrane protein YgaE (UPF0421/DUF939 family)
VQAGVAVALAWLIARELLGHETPYFAPIAAIIALGQRYFERGRRAAELAVAVTLGVFAAELLAYELGRGMVQLGLAVGVAVTLGMFFGTSALFVNQVAISAALVFTLAGPGDNFSIERTLDALTGGAVALAVAALVLPVDPLRLLRDAARPVLDELAGTLDDVAAALRARDEAAAEAALVRARGIDDFGARFYETTRESRSAARISLTRWRARDAVEFYAEAAARVDLAVRNVRVLARGTIRALALDENVPPDVCLALDSLAAAVRALADALTGEGALDGVREPALRAASLATQVLEGTSNLSVSVIVGQVRSTATDLLTGTGMAYEEAAAEVRRAAEV